MAIEESIRKKLELEFKPQVLELSNESHRHHAPKGAESHFKLLMVSPVFEGVSRLQRQQKLHQLLKEELAGPVHAFTMKLFSPTEWHLLPEEQRGFEAIGHHPKGKRKPQ